jgi:uncharacterized delta-60 repeat protein
VLALVCVCPSPAGAAPGDRDRSFSDDGLLTTRLRTSASDLVVQADGKPVVAVQRIHAGAPLVARFGADGEPDASFSGDGYATAGPFAATSDRLSLALQADGGLLLAGSYGIDGVGQIARYTPQGELDPSFGSRGVSPPVPGSFDDVAAAPNGSVVAVGNAYESATDPEPGSQDVLVARFTAAGALDNSFSDDGLTTVGAPGASDYGVKVAVQPDGRVMVGARLHASLGGAITVLRLDTTGALDSSFSGDGMAPQPSPGPGVVLDDLSLGPDGGLAVASRNLGSDQAAGWYVSRLLADGSPDLGFAGDGSAEIEVPGRGSVLSAAVAFAERGALFVAGGVYTGHEGADFALARLLATGEPDPGFARGRIVETDLTGLRSSDEVTALALDPLSRPLLAGSSTGRDDYRHQVALARYRVDEGPADADADGVLDRDDRCPTINARPRNGCRRFRPELFEINYQRRIDDFSGRVDFGRAELCDTRAVVKVYERRRGPDRLVGKSEPTRNSLGHWEVSAREREGRFYAQVVRRLARRVGVCRSGRSKPLRL